MPRRWAVCWCTDDSHARHAAFRIRRAAAALTARRLYDPARPQHLIVRMPGGQVEREDAL